MPDPCVKFCKPVTAPENEPLKEPVNTEPVPVEIMELDPILKVLPLKEMPLFFRAPPTPAIIRLPSVKTEEVIWARWAFEPLTIIFFQVAIIFYSIVLL